MEKPSWKKVCIEVAIAAIVIVDFHGKMVAKLGCFLHQDSEFLEPRRSSIISWALGGVTVPFRIATLTA